MPSQIRRGLLTIGTLDKLDHNPASTTAKGSVHGTGSSLFHLPNMRNLGEKQDASFSANKYHKLPDSFINVPAVALNEVQVSLPEQPTRSAAEPEHFDYAKANERKWLDHAIQILDRAGVENGDTVVWSASHASQLGSTADLQTTLSQLLGLCYEKTATTAMIKHGMDVVHWATKYRGQGQIPVIAFDTPLYALTKFTQYKWHDTHGEDKLDAMLGGLRIEMATSKTIADYLEGSGWTNVLTQSGVASVGTADSFLKAFHLTRHAHQVTAPALAKLQQNAFL